MEKNKEFILVEKSEATLENFTPEFFENFLKGVSIEKIYKGKDLHCRCGCGGKYYEPSSKSFKGVLTRAKKALEFLREYGDKKTEQNFAYNIYGDEGYINIPIYNEFNSNFNQCYCIHFKFTF